jgi:hypothetical protein
MGEGTSERPPPVNICWWIVAETTAQARQPVAPFDARHVRTSRGVRTLGIGKDEEPRRAERLGICGTHNRAGIAEVAVDHGFGGRIKPKLVQPMNGASIFAAGVNHEVGGQSFASVDDEPSHPSLVTEMVADQRVVARPYVWELLDSPTYAMLQQRPGHEVSEPRRFGLGLIGPNRVGLTLRTVRNEILSEDARNGARLFEVIAESGKELIGDAEATGKQGMEVLSLRDTVSGRGRTRNIVAIYQDDLGKVVRQDSGREQARHTTA